MRYYFAYGSNMSPAQMAVRCPGARAIGAACLSGWRFHANKRGSASILPKKGHVVHGVVWRCSPAHFHALDRYEGVRWGNYRRRLVRVQLANGNEIYAAVYAGTRTRDGRARIGYMFTAVLPGAEAFGLPESYIAELRSWLPKKPIGDKRTLYRGRTKPLRFPI